MSENASLTQIKQVVLILLTFSAGMVFVLSGLAKMWDLGSFGERIIGYDFLPESLAIYLAAGICVTEVILGILLISRPKSLGPPIALFAIIICFTALALIEWANGNNGDCGCFGNLVRRDSGPWLLVENLLICGALGIIILVRRPTLWRGK